MIGWGGWAGGAREIPSAPAETPRPLPACPASCALDGHESVHPRRVSVTRPPSRPSNPVPPPYHSPLPPRSPSPLPTFLPPSLLSSQTPSGPPSSAPLVGATSGWARSGARGATPLSSWCPPATPAPSSGSTWLTSATAPAGRRGGCKRRRWRGLARAVPSAAAAAAPARCRARSASSRGRSSSSRGGGRRDVPPGLPPSLRRLNPTLKRCKLRGRPWAATLPSALYI